MPEHIGNEKIVFKGKFFEVVHTPVNIGGKIADFESVRRAPGVRLLIVGGRKILLINEFRRELSGFDWRLPGGKVFDSLEEYRRALGQKKDMLSHAIAAAKKECAEETGLVAKSIRHFYTAQAGLTVKWDMFYFIIDKFEGGGGQKLEDGEIIQPAWKTFEEAKQMCINGDVKEDRTLGVLLRFLLAKSC